MEVQLASRLSGTRTRQSAGCPPCNKRSSSSALCWGSYIFPLLRLSAWRAARRSARRSEDLVLLVIILAAGLLKRARLLRHLFRRHRRHIVAVIGSETRWVRELNLVYKGEMQSPRTLLAVVPISQERSLARTPVFFSQQVCNDLDLLMHQFETRSRFAKVFHYIVHQLYAQRKTLFHIRMIALFVSEAKFLRLECSPSSP